MKSVRERLIEECQKRKIDHEPADIVVGIMADTWLISTDELTQVFTTVFESLVKDVSEQVAKL